MLGRPALAQAWDHRVQQCLWPRGGAGCSSRRPWEWWVRVPTLVPQRVELDHGAQRVGQDGATNVHMSTVSQTRGLHISPCAAVALWKVVPGKLRAFLGSRGRLDWGLHLVGVPVGGKIFLLQCSCLENPTDGGAWWATVHGVKPAGDAEKVRRQNCTPGKGLPTSWPVRLGDL